VARKSGFGLLFQRLRVRVRVRVKFRVKVRVRVMARLIRTKTTFLGEVISHNFTLQ
jgi:hypothetical protein